MLRSNSSPPPTRSVSEAPSECPEPVVRKSVPLPRNVLREEAVTILRLLRRHWEPRVSSTGERLQEGFVSIGEARLPHSTADHLEGLIAKIDAEDRAAGAIGRSHVRERADVGRDLHATLSGVAKAAFLRTVDPVEAEQARELEKVHVGASSALEVAAALEDYSAFLGQHIALVDGLGGFGPETLVAAKALAVELRAYGCPDVQERSKELFNSRPLTARETHLLCQRIRHYAKFLFRTQPEIYRQFTSVYLRVQRARLRRQVRERARKKT